MDLGYREVTYRMPDTAETALDWKPNRQQLLIIITLAIVCLLVALDASIIVTSLNVCMNEIQRRP